MAGRSTVCMQNHKQYPDIKVAGTLVRRARKARKWREYDVEITITFTSISLVNIRRISITMMQVFVMRYNSVPGRSYKNRNEALLDHV